MERKNQLVFAARGPGQPFTESVYKIELDWGFGMQSRELLVVQEPEDEQVYVARLVTVRPYVGELQVS